MILSYKEKTRPKKQAVNKLIEIYENNSTILLSRLILLQDNHKITIFFHLVKILKILVIFKV